jgi:NADPH-dependent glutamate synthase beta subunit-like oxidoreductase
VIPAVKNGKRVACIGAGPASLTVANDLLPLGYEVVILEQWDMPGGLMRTNIPAFRLPETVIAEEIGYITGMGAEIRYNSRVDSLKKLLATGGFDAVFVGSGAPKGKELDLPGRKEGDANIHIGIQWLESVAFKHLDKIGEKVLIIGVGNTAMDCCRSSLRLGAHRRESDGAQAAPVLQGLRVGARGRRGRERRDRRQPLAQGVRGRGRPAQGHDVRPRWSTSSTRAAASPPSVSWARRSSPPTT